MEPTSRPPTLPVTVVIPAHDRAGTIERAIRSAQAQRPLPPAEIIVVDDCSGDDTAARARAAGATVVRHERNRGPGAARNTALEAASQPWTAFLDSDDVWLPDHLAEVARVWHDHVLVSAPGVVLPVGDTPARLVGNGHGHPVRLDAPPACLAPENLVATSGTVVSTAAARAAGGFPTGRRSEDLDLWLRLLEQGSGLALARPGYVYSPAEGHASADGAGMRAAAVSYLTGYADRSWYDPGLLRRLTAQARWDDLRAAMAGRRPGAALRDAAWLGLRPAAAGAVARLLVYRRTARRGGDRALRSLGGIAALTDPPARGGGPARPEVVRAVPTGPDERSRPVLHGVLADWPVNAGNGRARLVLLGYRSTRALRCSSRLPARLLGMVCDRLYRFVSTWLLGVEIPWLTEIGPRLSLPHPHGIVINAWSRIGADVVLRHGVTLGSRRGPSDCPVIGDGVDIGAGASVIGAVTVGDGARLGLGAVVLHDVPAGRTAIGNPAVVLAERPHGEAGELTLVARRRGRP